MKERAIGISYRGATRWGDRTAAQRRATAVYIHSVRPVLAVWSEVLRAITTTARLDSETHYYRLMGLRSELEHVEVPPDAEYAHVALINALDQTLFTCRAILTQQPRAIIDHTRDAALISFNAFEIEVVYLAGVERDAPAPA